jgi:hypothetical protein
MSKQTALQWYIEQCENIKYNPLEKNGYTIAKEKITKQALQMEREQIIDAYYEGKEYGFKEQGEQYYNETYGGQK